MARESMLARRRDPLACVVPQARPADELTDDEVERYVRATMEAVQAALRWGRARCEGSAPPPTRRTLSARRSCRGPQHGGRADRLVVLKRAGPGGETEDGRRAGEDIGMHDDVQIHTTRLDAATNLELMALAKAGAAAFGYTAELALNRQLAQLLRLRVAQINNCTYCLNVHYDAARNVGIPQAKINFLSAWWETQLFSEAERAALQYAEALTRAADTTVAQAFQQYHDSLAAYFDEPAMLEIVAVVINMNIWTRLKLAEGAMPSTQLSHGHSAPGPSAPGFG
jgi:AhpD family alkylhydroperoxidase